MPVTPSNHESTARAVGSLVSALVGNDFYQPINSAPLLTLQEELAAFFEVFNDMRRNPSCVAARLDTAATQLAQEFAHEFAQESDFEKSLMVQIAQLTGLQYDHGAKRILVVEDCGFKVEIRQQITACTACFESLPVALATVPMARSDIGILLTHNKFGQESSACLGVVELKVGKEVIDEPVKMAKGPLARTVAYLFGWQVPCMESLQLPVDHSLAALITGRKIGCSADAAGLLVEGTKPVMFDRWTYCCPAVVQSNQEIAATVVRVLATGLRAAHCFKTNPHGSIAQSVTNSTQIGLVPQGWKLKLLGSPILHHFGFGVPINQGAAFRDINAVIKYIDLLGARASLVNRVNAQNQAKPDTVVLKLQGPLYRRLVSAKDFRIAQMTMHLQFSGKDWATFPYYWYSAEFSGVTLTITEKMVCNELTQEDVRANPHILEGIVRQLSQLLKTGLTHCDVRFPNICLHEGFTRLLDLESI
ncbi:unnamed protein product, partial [Symbiodinium natans]